MKRPSASRASIETIGLPHRVSRPGRDRLGRRGRTSSRQTETTESDPWRDRPRPRSRSRAAARSSPASGRAPGRDRALCGGSVHRLDTSKRRRAQPAPSGPRSRQARPARAMQLQRVVGNRAGDGRSDMLAGSLVEAGCFRNTRDSHTDVTPYRGPDSTTRWGRYRHGGAAICAFRCSPVVGRRSRRTDWASLGEARADEWLGHA